MLHAHSGLRLLILLFLVAAIVKSLAGWLGKKPYGKTDNLIGILLLSVTHLQVLVGIVVYAMSDIVKAGLTDMGATMKNSGLRFWTVEHAVAMLLLVVLITVGRVKSKKADTDELKHKKGAIFYIIALILILWAGVIKPFALGRGWF
ncbi:MAG: cytochrome B [Flavobacteriales bacterium]|nr:MAG: cytochrome B [Flavobacteriales bacterium]